MVNEFIDYMGAAVGMVLIFVSAMLYLSGFSVGGIAYTQQQNMAMQAQSLFDYILSSPGSPQNWGATASYPTAFGLQQAGAQPYTLDPEKILRLLEPQECTLPNAHQYQCISTGIPNFYFFYPTTYYLPYSYARSLVAATPDFEFQLRLTPAINVTVYGPSSINCQDGSDGPCVYKFPLSVYTYSGAPVVDAGINATFIAALCAQKSDGNGGGSCSVQLYLAQAQATSDSSGRAQLSFNVTRDFQSYSVVATAQTAAVEGLGFYTQAATKLVYVDVSPQENNITVVRSCSTQPCSVAYPNITTYVFTGGGLGVYSKCQLHFITKGNGFQEASCSGLPQAGLVGIGLATSNCNGESSSPECVVEALVAPVNLFAAFNLDVVYGGPGNQDSSGSTVSTTLTRIVDVAGFTYVASFTYWPDYGPVYGD
jgi:hypothetical protein